MENTGYITITRQTGLAREMQVVANNIELKIKDNIIRFIMSNNDLK